MKSAPVAFAACLLAAASGASAQSLDLQLRNGRVSVDARGVPVAQILERWAALSGATIEGAKTLADEPVTLQLADVPERDALEVVLRGVAGYVLAGRATPGGASTVDRILILGSSSAPATPPSAGPRTPPAPSTTQAPQSIVESMPQVGLEPPEQALVDISEGWRDQETIADLPGQAAPQAPPPATSNPFGVVSGSPVPGVSTAPPPRTPNRPAEPTNHRLLRTQPNRSE